MKTKLVIELSPEELSIYQQMAEYEGISTEYLIKACMRKQAIGLLDHEELYGSTLSRILRNRLKELGIE